MSGVGKSTSSILMPVGFDDGSTGIRFDKGLLQRTGEPWSAIFDRAAPAMRDRVRDLLDADVSDEDRPGYEDLYSDLAELSDPASDVVDVSMETFENLQDGIKQLHGVNHGLGSLDKISQQMTKALKDAEGGFENVEPGSREVTAPLPPYGDTEASLPDMEDVFEDALPDMDDMYEAENWVIESIEPNEWAPSTSDSGTSYDGFSR